MDKSKIIIIALLMLTPTFSATGGDECSGENPIKCVELVYDELSESQNITFKDMVLITYYGELSILDHSEYREYVVEAFVRNIYDSQSGLIKCYLPVLANLSASNKECLLEFLATSQHWRDSVRWYQGEWEVNLDKLTGKGDYLNYSDIMEYVINPDESWRLGQSYTRPSVWGNTRNVKFKDLPKETQEEIFVWLNYDYNGCQYSFFIATIEVRNIKLEVCEQEL